MRCVLWIAVAAAGCGATEAETLLTIPPNNGIYSVDMAMAGDLIFLFDRTFRTYDTVTEELTERGELVANVAELGPVAASEGYGYWLHDLSEIGRVDLDGNVEIVPAGSAPRNLFATSGCAYYVDIRALMGWCPSDPVPVELVQNGPGGTFTVHEGYAYWWDDGGLAKADLATGLRQSLLTEPGALGWRVTVYEDEVYWLADPILSKMSIDGGLPTELGALRTGSFIPRLQVDENGYYSGFERLRRTETNSTVWLPADLRCADPAIGGGYAYFLCDGTRLPVEDGTVLYRARTDGDSVVIPGVIGAGGEVGYIRPPFL